MSCLVNGTPSTLLTVETNDDVVTPETIGNDVGPPTDNSSEDTVYSDSTETSSFLTIGEQQELDATALKGFLAQKFKDENDCSDTTELDQDIEAGKKAADT
ncbi:Hypothetical predicted protein, partial [Paramuricea clavata]